MRKTHKIRKKRFSHLVHPAETTPYDAGHIRRYRIARLCIIPVVVVAIIVGSGCIGLWGWALSSVHTAQNGHIMSALSGFRDQEKITRKWPESWRAHYNIGTSELMRSHLPQAVTELATSLDRLPSNLFDDEDALPADSDECMVRINLSIAYERVADTRTGLRDKDLSYITGIYRQAAKISYPCASGKTMEDLIEGDDSKPEKKHKKTPSEKQAERGKEAHQRQNKKAGISPSSSSHNGKNTKKKESAGASPSPSASPDSDEAQRRHRLEQRNRDAREQGEGSGSDSGVTPPSPTQRNW